MDLFKVARNILCKIEMILLQYFKRLPCSAEAVSGTYVKDDDFLVAVHVGFNNDKLLMYRNVFPQDTAA